MKYIGKRTCYCPIEDDEYLGSGTFLKQAVDIYGEQYFKKEILCTCKTEEEAWEKEEEMIEAFDAVGNKEYYNVAFGGPSRPNGFAISDMERDKMEYLNNLLENQEYYGAKVLERGENEIGIPRIILARTDGKIGWHTTTISRDIETNRKTKIKKDITTMVNRYQRYKEKDGLKWFYKDGGGNYTPISKSEYYNYMYELTDWQNFDESINNIYMLKSRYKNNTNYFVTDEKINDNQTLSNIGKKTNIDYIEEYAKTSSDYKNFLNLLYKYNDLDLVVVYHAVTGRGSISGDSFKNGNFKCTKADVEKASQILDFESRFTDVIQTIKGRRDYLYVVLGFCYNCELIDNDELFNRFIKYYNKINPIKSIDQIVCDIDYIYNYRKPKNQKVFIKHEYVKDKTKR